MNQMRLLEFSKELMQYDEYNEFMEGYIKVTSPDEEEDAA